MGKQNARFRNGADGPSGGAGIEPGAGDHNAQPDQPDTQDALSLLDAQVGRFDGPPLRPRPAAALIMLDAGGERPKVLMGRRNPNLAFMGGLFVFPGGRVDRGDSRLRALLDPFAPPMLAERLCVPALAAIRETFEETGYLVGARESMDSSRFPAAWREFAAHGVIPKLDGVCLIARAVTPPGRVRRFDTYFFCVDASQIAGFAARCAGPLAELVETAWVAIEDARDLRLPVITRVVLDELRGRLARGVGSPAPVGFYRQIRGRWRRDEM